MSNSEQKLRIAFIHPDLGIGGAEQLIINMAIALQQKGHYVKIYTPYHDKNHCFKETKDGTIDVEVRGSLFPRQIFGKFIALCAYIRMILAALWIIFYGGYYDCIIVDQVSVCVPYLRFFRRKVLFYCHFPDKLLCVERTSIFKKIYRFFLDLFEEITLLSANLILVNSNFTQQIFYANFPILKKMKKPTEVLYPSIDLKKFDDLLKNPLSKKSDFTLNEKFFLSLNRYERKKNIGLAIKAFAIMKKTKLNNQNIKLVIAGGYDPRITENLEHKNELTQLSKELNVENDVIFRTSISDEERTYLLMNSLALLYTPANEHFGIVPLEAQYYNTPVLASNSGGPKETVIHKQTGFLIDGAEEKWAEIMDIIANNEKERKEMGVKGKSNVIEKFSFHAFTEMLDSCVKKILGKSKKL